MRAQRPIQSEYTEGGVSYRMRRIITITVLIACVGGAALFSLLHREPKEPTVIPVIHSEGTFKQRPEQPGGLEIPHQDVAIYQSLEKEKRDDAIEHLLPPSETPQISDEPEEEGTKTTDGVMSSTMPVQEEHLKEGSLAPINDHTEDPSQGVSRAVISSDTKVSTQNVVEASPLSIGRNASAPLKSPTNKTAPIGSSLTATTLPSSPLRAVPQNAEMRPLDPLDVPPSSEIRSSATARSLATADARTTDTIGQLLDPNQKVSQTSEVTLKSTVVVQLASSPDRSVAERAANHYEIQLASSLGSIRLHVVTANLGQKGTYYRVQTFPLSSVDANHLCSLLKKQNIRCFIVR